MTWMNPHRFKPGFGSSYFGFSKAGWRGQRLEEEKVFWTAGPKLIGSFLGIRKAILLLFLRLLGGCSLRGTRVLMTHFQDLKNLFGFFIPTSFKCNPFGESLGKPWKSLGKPWGTSKLTNLFGKRSIHQLRRLGILRIPRR